MEFNLKVEFGFSFTDRRLRVGKTTDFELNAFRVRTLVRWLYDGDQGTKTRSYFAAFKGSAQVSLLLLRWPRFCALNI